MTPDEQSVNSADMLSGSSTVQRHNLVCVSGIGGLPTEAGIYNIVCTENGKEYIGSAVRIRNRIRDHFFMLKNGRHHSRHLQRSWNKYGCDKFRFGVIEFVELKSLLIAREQHYLNSRHPKLNCCPCAGSTLGRKASRSAKLKMSAAGKLKVFSDETRERISLAMKRFYSSKVQRRAMAKRAREAWAVPGYRKRTSLAISKSFSEEERKRRSEWMTNFYSNPEARAMISKVNKGKMMSKETRAKISDAVKLQWANFKKVNPSGVLGSTVTGKPDGSARIG